MHYIVIYMEVTQFMNSTVKSHRKKTQKEIYIAPPRTKTECEVDQKQKEKKCTLYQMLRYHVIGEVSEMGVIGARCFQYSVVEVRDDIPSSRYMFPEGKGKYACNWMVFFLRVSYNVSFQDQTWGFKNLARHCIIVQNKKIGIKSEMMRSLVARQILARARPKCLDAER